MKRKYEVSHMIIDRIDFARDEGVLELALDRGVLTGGGKEIPLCEVEIELKEGSQSFADHYAKCLAQKYGLIPQPHSKFRRALALRGESIWRS